MAFREDTLIYPAMLRLSGCLCAELAASELGSPCFCGVVEGTEDNLDCGTCKDGCGAAWVRLVQAYPSVDFPDPAVLLRDTNCNAALAFQLEVGVKRCFSPFADARGTAQPVAERLRQTRLQLADMSAMRRAIACCFANSDTDYMLGVYTPISFQGTCGGGSWLLTVAQES